MDRKIIIVDDGAYHWGAYQDDLERAMEQHGWTREGRYWVEPERADEDDSAAAYNALCQAVQPVPGMDIDDDYDRHDYQMLYCRPDMGGRTWELV